MRYKSFRIQNFKGIKDTTVSLETVAGASVFAFVGLNESGKTTVLEAIHSFSPDTATSELQGGGVGVGVPIKQRVPRHQISTFTGEVSVQATLIVTDEDRDLIEGALKAKNITIDKSAIPDVVSFTRRQRFLNGDFKFNIFELNLDLKIKTGKQRVFRDPNHGEKNEIRSSFYGFTPDIAYFPTFIFDFPSKIYLSEKGDRVDQFYRRVFQDVLDYDGQGLTIERDIVGRIRTKSMVVPWLTFLGLWSGHEDRRKIDHVIDRAGAAVSKLVFGRWNKIFGEDTRGKEIVLSYDVIEGEIEDDSGVKKKTEEHDIFVRFQIKDGTRRFDINDRSLGFRWFFAFMMFTQFRVARSSTRPLLFLFDEPASNLHAAAQQKLIECFPGIAQGKHALAYSTHSHYMIEPKWLEQTFIVTNRSEAPQESVLDEVSLDDESLDVQVDTYRSFVNKHPGQTSYFQPILDRLDVVPSKFDAQRASVVVEGKSDYYILRYSAALHGFEGPAVVPGIGAGTFGSLVALHIGWGLNFLFLLDGDKQGETDRKRYVREHGLPEKDVVTISEIVEGVSEIEDLLDESALDYVQNELGLSTSPDKGQIRRFFQERLASENVQSVSAAFDAKSRALLEGLATRLKG